MTRRKLLLWWASWTVIGWAWFVWVFIVANHAVCLWLVRCAP